MALAAVLACSTAQGEPQQRSSKAKTQQTTRSKARSTSKSKGKQTSKSKTKQSGTKKAKQNAKAPAGREELQRRHQEAQKDIAKTREQIKANDREISKNLTSLGKLQNDIDRTKTELASSAKKVKILGDEIGGLQQKISVNEQELSRLRGEYLKAVKKMRVRRKGNSTLAYLFSSKSLGEARRRMRYLKEFSDWRKQRSSEIEGKVAVLRDQRAALARDKSMQDKALAQQQTAQRNLEGQYRKQDAIVVELKANGTALRKHLAQKQSEANSLKGQVAALIAAEQRAAEQREAARRAEEARKAEEERRAEEQRQAEERQQQLAQNNEQQEAAEKKENAKKQEPKKNEKKADSKKAADKKGKQKKTHDSGKRQSNSKDYAQARKRRPRSESGVASAPSAPKTSAPAKGGFESLRGSLPRPVTGAFTITSRFGVHALPDLPDVMYDNPGIDAQTAVGATAQSVYGGKVSGVYMIPGFSTVVIVNHGQYYTVYGNLSAASVKVGDVVKQGQGLGHVATDEDDSSHGLIHFEVWKGREKQNPQNWIR